ncbi:MAG: isopentenyl phosphate kinase [Promethearchaeota archaeon]
MKSRSEIKLNEKEITIIKIGGSCFSDKTKPRSIFFDVIDAVCEQIRKNKLSSIIVHGGGSYGHPTAKKYKIKDGRDDGIENQQIGFCLTHLAMMELNQAIINQFLSHSVSAYPVQSSAIFQTKNDEIIASRLDIVEQYLKEGFTPVLYGDTVLDAVKGYTILSGDTIIRELIDKIDLKVKRVIFLLDVNGLYYKNPKKYPDAKLIRDIFLEKENILVQEGDERKNLESLITTGDDSIDVTGGIMFKLKELTKLLNRDIDVYLMNGQDPESITKLLEENLEMFTKVHFIR